jgi:hypothetical protein
MSRMLFVYVLFVCFFVIYIHVLYIRDFAQSFVYLSMFDLKNKIETYFVQYVCHLIRALFSALFFFFLFFVYLHCTSCYSVMARIYKQETSNYQSIYCSFCFCFLDQCHQDTQQLLQRLKYLRKYVIEEHSKFYVTIIISMNIKQ